MVFRVFIVCFFFFFSGGSAKNNQAVTLFGWHLRCSSVIRPSFQWWVVQKEKPPLTGRGCVQGFCCTGVSLAVTAWSVGCPCQYPRPEENCRLGGWLIGVCSQAKLAPPNQKKSIGYSWVVGPGANGRLGNFNGSCAGRFWDYTVTIVK